MWVLCWESVGTYGVEPAFIRKQPWSSGGKQIDDFHILSDPNEREDGGPPAEESIGVDTWEGCLMQPEEK